MRLLDTRSDTYIWSEAYNLEEAATSTERPTLVERVRWMLALQFYNPRFDPIGEAHLF